ncbi:MAG: trigger factor [Deltaproteobacteria bacterium RIFOXYA12_FULL_58_15]|nr:MAG: trigger factor [Deltaproteobacteria bacterium RIFOXYA12_FULL_58_15]OGR13144.1 MAG: trigger factor [Deltaproteobacteria bacterium RIFOXYB12_FULL_58_9]
MEVEVEEVGPAQRKLSVTVPAATVDNAFNKAFKQVGRNAVVPGFRPGKVPRGLLELHYGNQVRGEVQQELVNTSLAQAFHEKEINPVGTPSVEAGELKKGADFSYVADVDIQPDIELGKYKYLVVEPMAVLVTDEEAQADLDALLQQSSQLVPILVRDVVESGDIVQMDYEAFVGGSAVKGSKAENALIEVGGEGYIPGFSEGLLGAKVPSDRELPINFPDDYTVKELAGKQATFKIQIKELKAKELPALDDEFAKDMGAENLEALKERVRGSIRIRKEREAQSERRKRLMEALVAANPFPVAPSLVDAQADRMITGAAMRVQQMMGHKMQLSDEDLAHLRKDSAKDAEFQVRSALLMLEVAKKEGLVVEQADIEAEIERRAEAAGNEAQRVRAMYADHEHRSALSYQILEDKTIAFLQEHAVATEEESEKATKAAAAQAKKADKAKTEQAVQTEEATKEEATLETTNQTANIEEVEVKSTSASKTAVKKKTNKAPAQKAPATKNTGAKATEKTTKKTAKKATMKKKA